MRMVNELNHLFLYPSTTKVYAPIDQDDKKKGSAIFLLTPDLKTSIDLTKLDYVHNPNLFTSFYIDRDPLGLINNRATAKIIDEKEENALSEAMVNAMAGSVKFKFDDNTSIMDTQYIRDVYNKDTVKHYARLLGIARVPDKINVVVHPTLSHLRKSPPKYIKQMDDDYYSYFDKGTIHVISKMVYDPESMRGDYNIYLLIELLYAIMISYNENLAFVPTMGIAMSIAGLEEWMKKNKGNVIKGSEPLEFAHSVGVITKRHGFSMVTKYIRTADINIFASYTYRNVMGAVKKAIFESDLSYYERQRLLPADFGIPEKRKYPIHDEAHVRAAIKLFNNCDPEDEKELAEAIIKRMKRFGIMDVKVSPSNRFSKYYKPKSNGKKHFHESVSLNSSNGYNRFPLSNKNPHDEFEELKNKSFDNNQCGEVFTDKDGNLVAWYMTTKDDNDNVWITDIESHDDDAYQYLIGAAMDYQNADYARTSDDSLYERLKSFGFKDIYETNTGERKLCIKESYDSSFNWEQVKEVCDSLSPYELSRITFSDTYNDSKFVIRRIIARVGTGGPSFRPAGFLDVYQFPSCPNIAQITLAVHSDCRGYGVARSMVNRLMSEDLHKKFNFDTYYWTAHTDNEASQNLALGAGFEDTNQIDKYGRKVFIKKVGHFTGVTESTCPIHFASKGEVISDEKQIITEDAAIFFEADTNSTGGKIGRFLYSERIKNQKDIILMYDKVKAENPAILRTYLKPSMYKGFNMFVDLSYYHNIFLTRNTFRMDNGINLYADFLSNLINNLSLRNIYTNRTLFIPVGRGLWPVQLDSDITDYKKNINPISLICRLVRTDLGRLRALFGGGGMNVVFVNPRGYFRVDFDKFDVNGLTRFKSNIAKLMSNNQPIADDYEIDTGKDTPAAIANSIIDRLEKGTDIKINSTRSARVKTTEVIPSEHLKINSGPMSIDKKNSIAIISIDPDGPDKFAGLNKSVLATAPVIDIYCAI